MQCYIFFIISCYFKNSSLTLLNLANVLITGDQIYTKALHNLKQNGQFHCVLLNFEELPEFVQTQDGSFKVEKHEIISGIAVDFHGMSQVQTLHKALTDAFRISSALLIMIGAVCSAVQYRDNKFYFFDSHSHDSSALSSPEGVSILIGFSSIDDLVSYLYALYQSMFIDLQTQFDILPISISGSLTQSNAHQMQKYFLDQAQKKQGHTRNLNPFKSLESGKNIPRSVYMKLYMQKKRKDKNFRVEEKDKDNRARKLIREDNKIKAKERDKK